MTVMRQSIEWTIAVLLAAVALGCDSVQPEQSGSLVVETFMISGERPADVLLRTTLPLDLAGAGEDASFARGAAVELLINGTAVDFEETAPGRYSPPSSYDRRLQAADEFRLTVDWNGSVASASGIIPPAIRLDSVVVSVPSEPVEAILVDSLRRDTLGVDATTGYIYPIETTAWWSTGQSTPAETWIQAQLRPQQEFTSVVVDFFLLPEEVFREAEADVAETGSLSWTGLYAIPVDGPRLPLTSHTLRVAIVRSDEAYADFATGRFDLDGRGPPSNVEGALGIAVGVSVDSVRVQVGQDVAGRGTVVFSR